MSYGNYNKGRGDNSYDRPRPYARRPSFVAQQEAAPQAPVRMTRAEFEAKGPFVVFKGNYYAIASLRVQSGPMITIRPEELHEDQSVRIWPEVMNIVELDRAAPLFAKYEGKYVVLLGKHHMERLLAETRPALLEGKLLSNPTLKRAVMTDVPDGLKLKL